MENENADKVGISTITCNILPTNVLTPPERNENIQKGMIYTDTILKKIGTRIFSMIGT